EGVCVFWAESNTAACDDDDGAFVNCSGVFRYDLAAFLAAKGPDPFPWDLDRDGTVGTTDFLTLDGPLWGTSGPCGDFDGDGTVGITDFLDLLAHWGPCCSSTVSTGLGTHANGLFRKDH